MQLKKERLIHATRCQVYETIQTQYCGFQSRAGATRYLKMREALNVEPADCRLAEKTGTIKINGKEQKVQLGVSMSFHTNLDCHPSFDRSVPPLFTAHNAGRTVFIGASNMGRIAKAAAENGHIVVDLTSSGWTPKPGRIKKLCETLEKLNLTEFDTVVIDPMSNSAYVGTDEDGLPIPAEKSDEDGRYHLYGDLQLAPPSAFKNCLKQMEKVLAFGRCKSRLCHSTAKIRALWLLCRHRTRIELPVRQTRRRVRRRRKMPVRSG